MLEQVVATASHGYTLGKRCASLSTKYSPHLSVKFVWGCDDYRNHLPKEESSSSGFGDELTLHFVDIWRKAYELGVEEVRRERVKVEVAPTFRSEVRGKRRVTTSSRKSKEKRAEELEKVEWV